MASTNKTTHYELSQYVGTDKPTYLVDYNQDMDKIDAGIYGAKSKADTNGNAIGDLTTLNTTVKTSLVGAVNEVDTNEKANATNIGTLSSLTTTEKTTLVGAINEVDSNSKTNTTNIGTLSSLTTTEKSNLVGAVNEVNSKAGIPTGSITMFAGNQAPAGYLLCDGSQVSRTTYANLFTVIGTTYGVGDGETSFNLPNLGGRVPMGVGTNDNTHTFNLGATGGEYEHTLTQSEMPYHTHDLTHTYLPDGSTSRWGTNGIANGGDVESTTATGGDQPHNNVQPYIALNYIIKI